MGPRTISSPSPPGVAAVEIDDAHGEAGQWNAARSKHAPAEIEEVAGTFAAVLDCAVVGIAHEHLGEVPALFVVPRPGQALDNDALLAHCRTHLSAYKVPHIVRTIGDIPRTGSGKIIRYKLRALIEG